MHTGFPPPYPVSFPLLAPLHPEVQVPLAVQAEFPKFCAPAAIMGDACRKGSEVDLLGGERRKPRNHLTHDPTKQQQKPVGGRGGKGSGRDGDGDGGWEAAGARTGERSRCVESGWVSPQGFGVCRSHAEKVVGVSGEKDGSCKYLEVKKKDASSSRQLDPRSEVLWEAWS